jgi:small-conductance mechanosensitive channel
MIEWYAVFRSVTNRIGVVILIILFGFIVGRIVGRLIFRGLKELELERFFRKTSHSFEEGVAQVIEYIIYVVTVLIALDTAGILVYLLSSIAGIIVLILALSALLSFRDFVPNLFCGLILKHKKSICVGECIVLGNIVGKVTKFGFLSTQLITKSGDVLSVPNCFVLRKRK